MKIGVHELEFEAPDLAIVTTLGEGTAADAQEMGDAIVAFSPGGRVFLLNHLRASPGESMSPKARKIFIDRLRHVTLVAVAVVGGNFQARIIVRLVETAMRVLSSNAPRFRFFDDEPSARAWLCTQGCVACGGDIRT